MSRFLIVYGTGEGQTARVAARIGEVLAERVHEVTVIDIEDAESAAAPEQFDAILVGSSIHVGAHHEAIREYVETNLSGVSTRPSAFFQLSLSSAVDDEARRAEAARYVDDLLEAADWNPDRIGLFGGALRYSKYGFLKRLLMKRIAKNATGDVDTSRDYEYTDWDEVEAFAADFAGFVERRLKNE
ncbi:flavodoxin domain-containing protein [Natranaeroarchaeum aerophilus]|uniref:Protoporphyrinogen oxidase n=1 Tax=Natranaeroarchaeum aerophilus TaxID=2917711 RepID=A0AAE3FU50_9EURY|nr:flavodoxin domain-containing protein [Natranaeroarchaeum aerophilus]MCL9815251.1 protoporphyrinogen oxidase [Natranaeroarchaeum aerophilus]